MKMAVFNELAAGSSKLINSSSETVNILCGISNAFSIISEDSMYVNHGVLFETSLQKTLSAGGTYDISFSTPPDVSIHVKNAAIIASAGFLTIQFYEGTSVSGGATVIAYNHNRVVSATASAFAITSANITALGTLLRTSYVTGVSGIAGTGGGGLATEGLKWILAENTNYNYRITNGASAANTITFNAYGFDATL